MELRTKAVWFFLTSCIVLSLVLAPSWVSGQQMSPDSYTAHLIGHAHIDLVWLWLWEETIHDISVNTFEGTMHYMDQMPGLTFAQSMAALYEAMEKNYPELFEEISRRIKEDTWCPVGGTWAESDLNIPKGEALVRQVLYGKQYFKEKFGVDVRVGWFPDTFGHSGNVPQIMKKAGIDYYVFGRCAPADKPIFWWKGIDGSKVLAYVPVGWYNVDLAKISDKIKDLTVKNADLSGVKDILFLYGAGDHGGGPRETDAKAIRELWYKSDFPELRFSSPQYYFEKILQQRSDFPEVAGELNFIFRGCYTTQAKNKYFNRKSENLLLTAEKFSVNSRVHGFRALYPKRDIDEGWKITLRNQFHDILPGSSIGPGNDEVIQYYQDALMRGKRALDFSLEAIGGNINTEGEGIPIVVFNPLSWERNDIVTTTLRYLKQPSGIQVVDSKGTTVPTQILCCKSGDGGYNVTIAFEANAVPSIGYKLYRAQEKTYRESPLTSLRVSPAFMSNDRFVISLDPQSGIITHIQDKAGNRDILTGNGNVLQLLEDKSALAKEAGPAWSLGLTGKKIDLTGPATISVLESGPVFGKIRVSREFNRSLFTQDIILYSNLPRIEFQMQAEWREREQLLKVAFPLNVSNGQANFEIPYGYLSRPANGEEVPALNWIDLSGMGYGVSLLNDCKYGFDINGNVMRMTILRSPLSPDPRADEGIHTLAYALYPHAGNFKDALTIREGEAFNNPLIALPEMNHAGKLPSTYSFAQVEPSNVILMAMKEEQGYWNRKIILRLFEAFGSSTVARVTLPMPINAFETNLLEEGMQQVQTENNVITTALDPFEIKTLRIEPKSGWRGF